MFALDARIAAGSHPMAQLTLCEARLQDDARFPWIVLVPRRPELVELVDLSAADQAQLWSETVRAGLAVRAVGRALGASLLKLNHGQLGNVVAQLHLHVVGRSPGDAAWPGPVWGLGAAETYEAEPLRMALEAGRQALLAS